MFIWCVTLIGCSLAGEVTEAAEAPFQSLAPTWAALSESGWVPGPLTALLALRDALLADWASLPELSTFLDLKFPCHASPWNPIRPGLLLEEGFFLVVDPSFPLFSLPSLLPCKMTWSG